MTAPTCRVGDEIEILNRDTGEWLRHEVTSLESTPWGRWTVHVSGEAYVWFDPNDLNFTWRYALASVPATEVCP